MTLRRLILIVTVASAALATGGCETIARWFIDRDRGCDQGGGCPVERAGPPALTLADPPGSAAPPEIPVYAQGVTDPRERAAFSGLLTDAYSALQSDRFRANLLSLSSAYSQSFVYYLGDDAPGRRTPVFQTPSELLDVVSGRSPYRYVRSPAFVVDGDEARAGWTGRDDQSGSMTIGRVHLDRWRSADPVEQSCAINTVAHEMTHLVSNRPNLFMNQITDSRAATLTAFSADGSPINPPRAVASYLIGTVAQCTWLQENGYSPAVDLASCVEVFGHRGYNKNRCQAFSGGRAVAPRGGLPDAHDLKD